MNEPWVQLATRIPKSLHRQLKLFAVTNDVSVMNFVVSALLEKLARSPKVRPLRNGKLRAVKKEAAHA